MTGRCHGDRIGWKGPGKTFEAGVKQTLPPPPMNYYWNTRHRLQTVTHLENENIHLSTGKP
ncbi:hypothetical protein DPEC_G00155790 [Dallia pectoralis]|uniref:Uncharacterized protein n=1 Tax=Dallia pectoralis TaxID=75939 RepID=A0ACC2GKJ8_DALPE|nr:hypothetical protein DPEC_G00155790 [Dallia pectoralis]